MPCENCKNQEPAMTSIGSAKKVAPSKPSSPLVPPEQMPGLPQKTYLLALPDPDNPTQQAIAKEVLAIGRLLLAKNDQYGNSALAPLRIHSDASTVEQLKIRADDKLSRLRNMRGKGGDTEDTLLDYIGYLILIRVASQMQVKDLLSKQAK